LLKVKMVIIMVNWFAMKTIVARIYHTQLTKARDIVKLFVANTKIPHVLMWGIDCCEAF